MASVIRQSRAAMGSRCEIILCGDDPEHLDAVVNAAFDEIARVEQLLSRFDPTSEISRVNRDAPGGACLVDVELISLLADCQSWRQRTDGAFDIAAGSRTSGGDALTFAHVDVDQDRRLVRFLDPAIRLDLGAYGKGYALDRAAGLIRDQQVTSACLQIGTSSVVAIGAPPDAPAWQIQIGGTDNSPPLTIALIDAALSTSATGDPHASDVIDPRTGQPLSEARCCTVVAPTGAAAEALSTALVVLGAQAAAQLPDLWNDPAIRVFM